VRAALGNARSRARARAEPPGAMWAAGGLRRRLPAADAAASQFRDWMTSSFSRRWAVANVGSPLAR
jgi:hypothetical protein